MNENTGRYLRKSIPASLVFLLSLLFTPVLSAQNGENEETARYWYERGRRSYLREDYYRAVEDYTTALEISPVYADAVRGLAQAYFSLQEFSEALSWAERAELYDRGNPELTALKGRILIGLGEYDEAERIFESILEQEPYNEDALFGLAELDIARGKILDAQTKYRDALALDPKNRRALLSLALIFDARGELTQAEELIELALHYYPSNAAVQYLAARHYYARGELNTAVGHAERAISIDDNYPEAVILKSRIHFDRSQYEEVIPLVRGIIGENRQNPYLWYLLGRSYDKEGDFDNAVQSYAQAFRAKPDDEISRISLEQMIIRETEMDDPMRDRYAEYHFNIGRELERRNYYLKALEEYRRGLTIAPFSRDGRLAYAGMFRTLGYLDKYLSELKVLEAEGFINRDVEDDLEIYGSLLEDSLAREWDVRQYPAPVHEDGADEENSILLDRKANAYEVALFYDVSESSLVHPGAEPVLAEELFLRLRVHDKIEPIESPRSYTGFADAFSRARNSQSDYFIIVNFQENERVFAARMHLYRSTTGTKIKEYSVIRTGNGRVREVISTIVEHFNDELPLRGRILKLRFDTALIDLGSWDGISEDTELIILSKDGPQPANGALELSYRERDVLGTITVTETDELVAAGTLESAVFFDMINTGDEVVPAPEQEDNGTEDEETEQPVEGVPETGASALELYRSILEIR